MRKQHYLPFSLLVPVFGMSSGALLLDECISPLRWCAAVLLVGGVALASLGRTPSPAPVIVPAPVVPEKSSA